MKKVDFLFVYEIKARELDSICLLRYELEKKGYTVAFANYWYYEKHGYGKFDAKVMVTSSCMSTDRLALMSRCTGRFDRAVDLQWEQVISSDDALMKNSSWSVQGMAQEIVRVCWGQDNKDFHEKTSESPPKNLKITGFIPLDFYRKEMQGFAVSKKVLYKRFLFFQDSKIALFISSLAYVDMPKVKYQYTSTGKDIDLLRSLSERTLIILLEWFREAAAKNPGVNFVYRPHPAELNSDRLKKAEDEVLNFHVIRDYTMREWILASDIIYTWASTGIVEIQASKKPCYVLRPVEIPHSMDMPYYFNCEKITSRSEFLKSLKNEFPVEFPISKEIFSNYYDVQERPTYKRVCDVLVEEYKKCDGSCDLQKKMHETFSDPAAIGWLGYRTLPKKEKIFRWVSKNTPYIRFVRWIAEHCSLKIKWVEQWKTVFKQQDKATVDQEAKNDTFIKKYINEKYKQDYAKPKEVRETMARIRRNLN